jgi:hypothetical protein
MNQPAEPTSTPPANGFTRLAERERRIDEALEAAAVTAMFTRELDGRAEQTVELLASIDVSLRRLVELAEKGGRT